MLNEPVIRDSYFGYKGQFGTEYVRNVKIMSLFSKTYIITLISKLPSTHVLIKFIHKYYSYLENIKICVIEIMHTHKKPSLSSLLHFIYYYP